MFKELQPLLENRTMVLMVAPLKDGQIQVSFIPKSTDKDTEQDKPLLQPLTITGTAEELDAELASAIADYAGEYKTISEQITAAKAAMKAANQQAAEEAKAKAKGKTPATPAKKIEPQKPAEKKETAPSLFGETEEEPTEVFEA